MVFCSVLLVIVVMVEGLTEIERVSEKSGSSLFSRSMTSRLDGGLFNTRELDSNVLADAIASEIWSGTRFTAMVATITSLQYQSLSSPAIDIITDSRFSDLHVGC